MQIHLWAKRKSPILFGAGLGEIKKRQAGRSGSPKIKKDSAGQHCPNLIFLLHTNFIYNSELKDKQSYSDLQRISPN